MEIITLRKTPTKEEMSSLISTSMDHEPDSARGWYNWEKGIIEVSNGKIPDLLDTEVNYPEAMDYIREQYGLLPMFGARNVVYNSQKRTLERI